MAAAALHSHAIDSEPGYCRSFGGVDVDAIDASNRGDARDFHRAPKVVGRGGAQGDAFAIWAVHRPEVMDGNVTVPFRQRLQHESMATTSPGGAVYDHARCTLEHETVDIGAEDVAVIKYDVFATRMTIEASLQHICSSCAFRGDASRIAAIQ